LERNLLHLIEVVDCTAIFAKGNRAPSFWKNVKRSKFARTPSEFAWKRVENGENLIEGILSNGKYLKCAVN
jgi:hypothetical protein